MEIALGQRVSVHARLNRKLIHNCGMSKSNTGTGWEHNRLKKYNRGGLHKPFIKQLKIRYILLRDQQFEIIFVFIVRSWIRISGAFLWRCPHWGAWSRTCCSSGGCAHSAYRSDPTHHPAASKSAEYISQCERRVDDDILRVLYNKIISPGPVR